MYIRYGKVIMKDQELQHSWNSCEMTLEDLVWLTMARWTRHRKTPLVPRDVHQGVSGIGAVLVGREQELEDSSLTLGMEDSQLECQMK